MQSAPIHAVLEAARNSIIIPNGASEAVMRFAPVVDGKSLPHESVEAFEHGILTNKPLMMGSNLNDGALFSYAISEKSAMSWEEYAALALGIFQSDWVVSILELYPPSFSGDNRPMLAELITDYFFLCSSRFALRKAQKAGLKQTFLYRFDYQPNISVWPKSQSYCDHKVCHGDELPFVFHDNGNPFPWKMNASALHFASQISELWTNFANSSNPGLGWPVFREQNDELFLLNNPLKKATHKQIGKEKNCDLFDKVGYEIPKPNSKQLKQKLNVLKEKIFQFKQKINFK